jgi:hypothetical protein
VRRTKDGLDKRLLVASSAFGVIAATTSPFVQLELLVTSRGTTQMGLDVHEAEVLVRIVAGDLLRAPYDIPVRLVLVVQALKLFSAVPIQAELEVGICTTETQILPDVVFELVPVSFRYVRKGDSVDAPIRA